MLKHFNSSWCQIEDLLLNSTSYFPILPVDRPIFRKLEFLNKFNSKNIQRVVAQTNKKRCTSFVTSIIQIYKIIVEKERKIHSLIYSNSFIKCIRLTLTYQYLNIIHSNVNFWKKKTCLMFMSKAMAKHE